MNPLKKVLIPAGLLAASLAIAGCSEDVPGLQKAKGSGVTYSEYFKPYDRMDEREHVTFYQPVALQDAGRLMPERVRPVIHEPAAGSLPFQVDEETVYLVSSKDPEGNPVYQVQASFLGKDEYEETENFLIITVTEAQKNPLAAYHHQHDVDSVGNRMTAENLAEGMPIYQQIRTTDSALLYTYYKQEGKRIDRVATAANEFYTYYDGYIYHAGYSVDGKKNDPALQARMLDIVRDYILGQEADRTL